MLTQHAAPESLSDAIRHFADHDVSFAFVVQLRWPDGVICPHCEAEKPMLLKTRRIWKCRACRKQFSVKIGTIFEDSPLGLDKWLPALWMLANCRNGISSYELGRALGVTQKTAWFMLGRIRLAMQTKTFAKSSGEVEADETFVGGLAKNMHREKLMRTPRRGTSIKGKVAVMGLLERKRGQQHSTVRLDVIDNVRTSNVESRIHANVERKSAIYSDALASYRRLSNQDYDHAAINHAIAYVDGKVHTNGLENFWSLLKRSIKGTYVSVDPFHLFRYLDEQAFRFNNRTVSDLVRFSKALREVLGKRLTYAELISAGMEPATT